MYKIDLAKFRQMEADGFLLIQEHPSAPLLIHNYAQVVQYERYWNETTLICRGLITDLEGKVIARPFPKFFNLDEHLEHVGLLPMEKFDVFEKMDGSLGVLYHWEGKPYIATRGSFQSEQAAKANQILQSKYAQVEFDPAYTYLFEIIYPENRIVVNYGEIEDLVLLGMIHIETGAEAPLPDLGMPVVKHYDGIADINELRGINETNREGFVVRFKSGLRVKVKFEEYVRLHKILTGITKRTIWEYLKAGLPMDEMLEKVPDEFFKWVKAVSTELEQQYAQIEAAAKVEYKTFDSRKESALYYQTCTYPSILFKMMDDRPHADIIWKLIYPKHHTPFQNAKKHEESNSV